MNYHNKKFRALHNSEHGEVSSDLVFHYQQEGPVLHCEYVGGAIVRGQLLGLVDASGTIEMRYHQINTQGQLRSGRCQSTPEILENGKIRLHERWAWSSGEMGESILEEM